MGESNTVVSAYTLYRHLQQYCCHPLIDTETVTTCESLPKNTILDLSRLKTFGDKSFAVKRIEFVFERVENIPHVTSIFSFHTMISKSLYFQGFLATLA